MAIKQDLITTTTPAIFTATESTAVTSIHLCNTDSGATSFNLYVVPNDGSTTSPSSQHLLYNSVTISAQDTYIIDTEKLILENGDMLFVRAAGSGSNNKIAVTVSTIGL